MTAHLGSQSPLMDDLRDSFEGFNSEWCVMMAEISACKDDDRFFVTALIWL
jgi:hypothetical protein